MRWDDGQPIYLQLKLKIVSAIMDGSYAEGALIPSIRSISAEYQINPITVSKSYQALVDEGVLEKRRGVGMVVAKGAQQKLQISQKKSFLKKEWPLIKNKIQRLGLSVEELLK